MSFQYSYKDMDSEDCSDVEVLIFGLGEDQRSMTSYNRLMENKSHLQSIILFQYNDIKLPDIASSFPGCREIIIKVESNNTNLLLLAEKIFEVMENKKVLIDITEIHVPDLFVLYKFIYLRVGNCSIKACYTTPLDYVFEDEPFLSYHSFHGDLKTEEVKGYGGLSSDATHSKMFIFLGFEGVLSQKVNEDIQYQDLVLVNNLPSIFAKYKDISIISNYELLKTDLSDIYYVPADNPFETYNFLNRQIKNNENVCIAPLSTKVVALGICLYALRHENVRIVYPTAQEYTKRHANEVHRTYVYETKIFKQI